MGIVKIINEKAYIVEAVGPVTQTPLSDWIERGNMSRIAIMRHKKLTAEKANTILGNAETYYGRGYDIFFLDDNEEIYCSELVYLTFGNADLWLGKKERVGDLFISNPLSKKLIDKRLRKHPHCTAEMSIDNCWSNLMEQELITPSSIANDENLNLIYSNYIPFY